MLITEGGTNGCSGGRIHLAGTPNASQTRLFFLNAGGGPGTGGELVISGISGISGSCGSCALGNRGLAFTVTAVPAPGAAQRLLLGLPLLLVARRWRSGTPC